MPVLQGSKDMGRQEGEWPLHQLCLSPAAVCTDRQVAHTPGGTLGPGTSAQTVIQAELRFWCLTPN